MCILFWVGWLNKFGVDVVVLKLEKFDVLVVVEVLNKGLFCLNKFVFCCCGCCGCCCCLNKDVLVEVGVGLNVENN